MIYIKVILILFELLSVVIYCRESQASMKSSNSLPRRDSSESKDSSYSVSGDDDSNTDPSYIKMFPPAWKRSLSTALRKQLPAKEKMRKASVPIPPSHSTLFLEQNDHSKQKRTPMKPKRSSIAVMCPVNIDTVREIEIPQRRKSEIFTMNDVDTNIQHSASLKTTLSSSPTIQPAETTLPPASTTPTNDTFVVENTNEQQVNNEPFYHELEIDGNTRCRSSISSIDKENISGKARGLSSVSSNDRENHTGNLRWRSSIGSIDRENNRDSYKEEGELAHNDGIEFYGVNIRVPQENVRIKMSEKHLTIQTSKVLCSLKYSNSYRK